jgi:hypothetical protein
MAGHPRSCGRMRRHHARAAVTRHRRSRTGGIENIPAACALPALDLFLETTYIFHLAKCHACLQPRIGSACFASLPVTANKFSASLQFSEIDLFALCCTCCAHAGFLAAEHAALASLDVQTRAACGYFFPFLIPSLLLLLQFITPDAQFSILPVD